jgi:hypothetical protein
VVALQAIWAAEFVITGLPAERVVALACVGDDGAGRRQLGPSANAKDGTDNALNKLVCSGQILLWKPSDGSHKTGLLRCR